MICKREGTMKMLNKEIQELKKWYEKLSWIHLKQYDKVPDTYNTILDLIEHIENLEHQNKIAKGKK